MKKFFISLSIIALFISCGNNTPKAEESVANETTSIEKPMLTLANFDTEAGDFVDKEIQIEGIVDHVCKHGGKRIFLVDDSGDVHVDAEERFDDALTGSDVIITGIVKELRIDEAYCLQMEEDQIQKHKEGVDSDDVFNQKKKQMEQYRDSMKSAGVDHLSFYTVEYISHEIK